MDMSVTDSSKSPGNELLERFLAKGSMTQRGLSRQLPRIHQPLLSRLVRRGKPTLRQALVLRAATGIPVESWLSASETEELREVERSFWTEAPASEQVNEVKSRVRAWLLEGAEGEERERMLAALRSLALVERDLLNE